LLKGTEEFPNLVSLSANIRKGDLGGTGIERNFSGGVVD
jgi:hypothetical protein